MSLILGRSLEYFYSCNSLMTCSYKLGSSPMLKNYAIKYLKGKMQKTNYVEIIFNTCPRAFGFLHTLRFDTYIDPKLVIQMLLNSRKVFPTGSFQIKTLKIPNGEKIIRTLMDCNPFGLVNLEICGKISDEEYSEIISIKSLQEFNFGTYSVAITKGSRSLKKVDINLRGYGEGIFFDLTEFPNLISLSIHGNNYLKFIGKVPEYLHELSLYNVDANLREFSSITTLNLHKFNFEEDTLEHLENLINLECWECVSWEFVKFELLKNLENLTIGGNYNELSDIKSFPHKLKTLKLETVPYDDVDDYEIGQIIICLPEKFRCETLHIIDRDSPGYYAGAKIYVSDSSFDKLRIDDDNFKLYINDICLARENNY